MSGNSESPKFGVRISRGLVTHWQDAPLVTWEQANECRKAIARMMREEGEIEEVLLSVPLPSSPDRPPSFDATGASGAPQEEPSGAGL